MWSGRFLIYRKKSRVCLYFLEVAMAKGGSGKGKKKASRSGKKKAGASNKKAPKKRLPRKKVPAATRTRVTSAAKKQGVTKRTRPNSSIVGRIARMAKTTVGTVREVLGI